VERHGGVSPCGGAPFLGKEYLRALMKRSTWPGDFFSLDGLSIERFWRLFALDKPPSRCYKIRALERGQQQSVVMIIT